MVQVEAWEGVQEEAQGVVQEGALEEEEVLALVASVCVLPAVKRFPTNLGFRARPFPVPSVELPWLESNRKLVPRYPVHLFGIGVTFSVYFRFI